MMGFTDETHHPQSTWICKQSHPSVARENRKPSKLDKADSSCGLRGVDLIPSTKTGHQTSVFTSSSYSI
ncbi:hypothetical protein AALO_G00023940 [Alosa alosa]|uniref:Uncharacterized protein n=1 Tax=Alosa alosa TaxID=278164 RepID=A0AAV6HA70_9TELE|nr:hypothetical protein AALO_G00023940 [Alosa alosa]